MGRRDKKGSLWWYNLNPIIWKWTGVRPTGGASSCDYTHARFWRHNPLIIAPTTYPANLIQTYPNMGKPCHIWAYHLIYICLSTRDAKSLVKHLLVADVTKRYGCLRNGANDIKNHRWFKNLDWFKLGQKRVPVPFIPQIGRPGDTSNFTEYPDSD